MSVTTVPTATLSEQSDPQLMPAGLEVTVPAPVPAVATVSAAAALQARPLQTSAAAQAIGALHSRQASASKSPQVRSAVAPVHDEAPAVHSSTHTPAKVAVTVVVVLAVTVQPPVPEQPPPDQPVKVEPAAGLAASWTTVPARNASLQSGPQAIPAGVEVTVPAPVPVLATVTTAVGVHATPAQTWLTAHALGAPHSVQGSASKLPQVACADVEVHVVALAVHSSMHAPVKLAVTVAAAKSVTTHGSVPLQPPPDQPVKVEAAAGTAVSVTTVPTAYASVQSAPQLMPAGAAVTVPEPAPSLTTVSVAAAVHAIPSQTSPTSQATGELHSRQPSPSTLAQVRWALAPSHWVAPAVHSSLQVMAQVPLEQIGASPGQAAAAPQVGQPSSPRTQVSTASPAQRVASSVQDVGQPTATSVTSAAVSTWSTGVTVTRPLPTSSPVRSPSTENSVAVPAHSSGTGTRSAGVAVIVCGGASPARTVSWSSARLGSATTRSWTMVGGTSLHASATTASAATAWPGPMVQRRVMSATLGATGRSGHDRPITEAQLRRRRRLGVLARACEQGWSEACR